MKKKLLLLSFLFLASCFSWVSEKNLDDAKKDLLENNSWNLEKNIENFSSWNLENLENISENPLNKNIENISSKYLTEEKFIEIDDFSISDFSDLEQEVTWKTLVEVDKIKVSFSNSSSSFKDDSFELKKFKAWDKNFMFRAFKKYENLDFGENIFIIEATSWEKISKLEYRVKIEKTEENEEKISELISIWDLPSSATFWNPIDLWNWKITYSDVKWLEIEQIWENILENSDSSVTDFLKNKLKNLFYWNTKRVISWEKWLSFFVVRIEKEKYFYEKHYYTWKLYWILSLEEWEFKAEWTIEEKANILKELNISLKEKNQNFPMEKIANILFQNLTR